MFGFPKGSNFEFLKTRSTFAPPRFLTRWGSVGKIVEYYIIRKLLYICIDIQFKSYGMLLHLRLQYNSWFTSKVLCFGT